MLVGLVYRPSGSLCEAATAASSVELDAQRSAEFDGPLNMQPVQPPEGKLTPTFADDSRLWWLARDECSHAVLSFPRRGHVQACVHHVQHLAGPPARTQQRGCQAD